MRDETVVTVTLHVPAFNIFTFNPGTTEHTLFDVDDTTSFVTLPFDGLYKDAAV